MSDYHSSLLSHCQLQIQALTVTTDELQRENNQLQYQIAVKEQDLLLLDAKLKEIAGFEVVNGVSLPDLRGQLLDFANQQIRQLSEKNNELLATIHSLNRKCNDLEMRDRIEVNSLREQNHKLSNDIAHRTVLYSAQERRWEDAHRQQQSLFLSHDTSLAETKAQLAQLKQQFERCDREKIDAIMTSRQNATRIEELECELLEAQHKISVLDRELDDASAVNMNLQLALDTLRGSDMQDLERDLVSEVHAMRSGSRYTEESLKRQLDESQRRVEDMVMIRDQLSNEVMKLRQEISSKDDIIREISGSIGLDSFNISNYNLSASLQSSHRYKDVEVDSIQSNKSVLADKSVSDVLELLQQLDITNDIKQSYLPVSEELVDSAIGDRLDISNDVRQLLVKWSVWVINSRGLDSQSHLTSDFLVGDNNESKDRKIELFEDEIANLKTQIRDLENREKKQKELNDKIIIRAGRFDQLEQQANDKIKLLGQMLADKEAVISELQQQLDQYVRFYPQELNSLREQMKESRAIGKHEASIAYSNQLIDYNNQLSELNQTIENLKESNTQKELEITILKSTIESLNKVVLDKDKQLNDLNFRLTSNEYASIREIDKIKSRVEVAVEMMFKSLGSLFEFKDNVSLIDVNEDFMGIHKLLKLCEFTSQHVEDVNNRLVDINKAIAFNNENSQKTIDELNNEIDSLHIHIDRLDDNINLRDSEIVSLRDSLADREQKLDDETKQSQSMDQIINKLNDERNLSVELNNRIQTLSDECKSLQIQLNSKSDIIESMRANDCTLYSQIDDLKHMLIVGLRKQDSDCDNTKSQFLNLYNEFISQMALICGRMSDDVETINIRIDKLSSRLVRITEFVSIMQQANEANRHQLNFSIVQRDEQLLELRSSIKNQNQYIDIQENEITSLKEKVLSLENNKTVVIDKSELLHDIIANDCERIIEPKDQLQTCCYKCESLNIEIKANNDLIDSVTVNNSNAIIFNLVNQFISQIEVTDGRITNVSESTLKQIDDLIDRLVRIGDTVSAVKQAIEAHSSVTISQSDEQKRELLESRKLIQHLESSLAKADNKLIDNEIQLSLTKQRVKDLEAGVSDLKDQLLVTEDQRKIIRDLQIQLSHLEDQINSGVISRSNQLSITDNKATIEKSISTKYKAAYDKLHEKYKRKLIKQKAHFDKERNEMLALVKRECNDIVNETLALINEKPKSLSTHSNTIYPEVLSPETTLELVRGIIRRSATSDDFKAILELAGQTTFTTKPSQADTKFSSPPISPSNDKRSQPKFTESPDITFRSSLRGTNNNIKIFERNRKVLTTNSSVSELSSSLTVSES